MTIEKAAVVGAGNMGSGIAQKIATEGFNVILADTTREQALKGMKRIETLLSEGVERKIFKREQGTPFSAGSRSRVTSKTLPTSTS